MTAPTSWLWLHVSDCGHKQQGAIPEMNREQAEAYGKDALLPENWLLSVPRLGQSNFLHHEEAAEIARRLRSNYLAKQEANGK